jgi:hypothetical protein
MPLDPKCRGHVDQKLWRDEPAERGLIRTVCSVCGKFIGYRPALRPVKEEAKGKGKK